MAPAGKGCEPWGNDMGNSPGSASATSPPEPTQDDESTVSLAEAARTKAHELGEAAKQEAVRFVEEGKRNLAEHGEEVSKVVGGVSDQIERLVPPAGPYVQALADQIQGLSSTLRERSVDDLLSDARRVAERRPGLLVAACFFAGFGLARLLKASDDRRRDEREAGRRRMRNRERRDNQRGADAGSPDRISSDGEPTLQQDASHGDKGP